MSLSVWLGHAKTGGALCALAGLAYLQPYRPMVVVGRSMTPTYSPYAFKLTEPVHPGQLRPGAVVVIDMNSGPIVKRIAFVPGDVIIQTLVDGIWIDLIYARPATPRTLARLRWRPFVVPKDEVYVLGDNQSLSYDSKQFGCVPIGRIHRILLDQQPFEPFPNRIPASNRNLWITAASMLGRARLDSKQPPQLNLQ